MLSKNEHLWTLNHTRSADVVETSMQHPVDGCRLGSHKQARAFCEAAGRMVLSCADRVNGYAAVLFIGSDDANCSLYSPIRVGDRSPVAPHSDGSTSVVIPSAYKLRVFIDVLLACKPGSSNL